MSASRVYDFSSHVRSGAEFLDERLGDEWHKRIDVNSLAMAIGRSCLLGQLGPSLGVRQMYADACEVLGLDPYGQGLTVAFGFDIRSERDLDENERKWAALTVAWQTEIIRRVRQAEDDDVEMAEIEAGLRWGHNYVAAAYTGV